MRGERCREHGAALIVTLLVMIIMTLIGIPFLLMGETENRIAQNERLALQAQYAAEAGAQMVKRWFDRPGDAANVRNPTIAEIIMDLRKIDEDGDPGTAPVQADGSAGKPYYKQTDNTFFDGPYRGGLEDAFLGTEDGPDIRIDENGTTEAKTFLADLSEEPFNGFPGAGQTARISRIDVFSAPHVQQGSEWKRHGIASVKVTARIYQSVPDTTETLLVERSVKFAVREIKYTDGVFGPVRSCGGIRWEDFKLGIHWGPAMAAQRTRYGIGFDRPGTLPRVPPPSADVDLLWAYDNDADWNSFYRDRVVGEGFHIEDPWFRSVAGDIMLTPSGDPISSNATQPYPFVWDPVAGPQDENMTFHEEPCCGSVYDDLLAHRAFLFQHLGPADCNAYPPFPYEQWKAVALAGGKNVHYYTWDSGSKFKENGTGPATELHELTNGKTGFFFFDTKDGNPPHAGNLTPPIWLAGVEWGVKGLVYLNAEEFHAHDVIAPTVQYRPPAEPFQDKDQDGVFDAGENWVNLNLNSVSTLGPFRGDATDNFGSSDSDPVWNDRGPVINAPAMVEGILFNTGYFDSRGTGNYYGAVVSALDVHPQSSVLDTPHIYWDASLAEEDWVPDVWGLPRVMITRWETDL